MGMSGVTKPKMVVECQRVSPHDIKELPPHILAEAESLREQANDCGLKLTEHVLRPLVQSTAIWLIRLGVTHTSTHPGVFRKVGVLLHDPKCLPMSMLQARGDGKVIPFESRLEEFMKNRIRNKNSTFQLEVSSEEQLNTPLRSLLKLEMPRVKVCDPGKEPAQGHSGRSIIGKTRSRVLSDLESSKQKSLGKQLKDDQSPGHNALSPGLLCSLAQSADKRPRARSSLLLVAVLCYCFPPT